MKKSRLLGWIKPLFQRGTYFNNTPKPIQQRVEPEQQPKPTKKVRRTPMRLFVGGQWITFRTKLKKRKVRKFGNGVIIKLGKSGRYVSREQLSYLK